MRLRGEEMSEEMMRMSELESISADEGNDDDDIVYEKWQKKCRCAKGTAFSRCVCGAN